jgi:hypothetical protein
VLNSGGNHANLFTVTLKVISEQAEAMHYRRSCVEQCLLRGPSQNISLGRNGPTVRCGIVGYTSIVRLGKTGFVPQA